jgi:hypothetical protein
MRWKTRHGTGGDPRRGLTVEPRAPFANTASRVRPDFHAFIVAAWAIDLTVPIMTALYALLHRYSHSLIVM